MNVIKKIFPPPVLSWRALPGLTSRIAVTKQGSLVFRVADFVGQFFIRWTLDMTQLCKAQWAAQHPWNQWGQHPTFPWLLRSEEMSVQNHLMDQLWIQRKWKMQAHENRSRGPQGPSFALYRSHCQSLGPSARHWNFLNLSNAFHCIL